MSSDEDFSERENKKILVIGLTGTGKSTLCNVLCGRKPNDPMFPTSARANSCTQKLKFADVTVNDEPRNATIIDTIGLNDDDHSEDTILKKLKDSLQDQCNLVNLFAIVVNGTTRRLDKSLVQTLVMFEAMFGRDFWKQSIIVFTNLPMDEASVKRRRIQNKGKSDDDLAQQFLQSLQLRLPDSLGVDYVILDSFRDEDDDGQRQAFEKGRKKMWKCLRKAKPLPTDQIKQAKSNERKMKELHENEKQQL